LSWNLRFIQLSKKAAMAAHTMVQVLVMLKHGKNQSRCEDVAICKGGTAARLRETVKEGEGDLGSFTYPELDSFGNEPLGVDPNSCTAKSLEKDIRVIKVTSNISPSNYGLIHACSQKCYVWMG
jgi:hypothetical protein